MTEQADRIKESYLQIEQSYFCGICGYPLYVPDPEYACEWYCENPSCPTCDESVLEEQDDNYLSDKLPVFHPTFVCDCCKAEPKGFWLDSYWVEVYLEEMEDGEIGYCAWVAVGDADIHTGVKSSYHSAKVAAQEIVDRELDSNISPRLT